LLSLLSTTLAIGAEARWPSLVGGLVWGLGVMIRPHALPFATLAVVYLAFQKKWLRASFVALGVLTLLVPWLVRNQLVLGHPVLLATESGETFLGSNNRYVLENRQLHGMWISPLSVPEYRDRLRLIKDEVERSRVQNHLAMDYLVKNPSRIPILMFYKLTRWLTPVTASPGLIRIVVLCSYGTLLALLLVGVALRIIQTSPALHLALLCTLASVAISAVYWGNLTRGRLPLEILWIPWGALVAWDLLERVARRIGATRHADVV
jgi:hypothetical protein